eukprot:CAMPEP_0181168002 /NCGR_PEP_ID=MMETSP1096-20121128/25_1 /TAXON_ID=156174 ORGANISM="Chrysochromulina ericina, Strain CCMP281" /NCGR_SAMPLE_ID=MMETSP1096 /ASSEMBLY_ACC=CAM_ASM_000453 /LENGTH=135 /DNA_ID=CAMNT_0023255317 /DNA_START=112 /DNA_END=518 /DNA_ORIENTATION=-
MTPTLAPEIIKVDSHGELEVSPRDRHNLLRPETVESLYFMWMVTQQQRYRRAAWQIFKAFRTYSRGADGAYTNLDNVFMVKGSARFRDEMPSYWLAETLKYLWLIFQPATTLPMDKWVFSTEAHPFRRFCDACGK